MSAIYTEEICKQIIHRLEQTIEYYKEQRKADRQMFLLMLDQFPPYGPDHNTKQEVEAWLAKARSMFVPIESKSPSDGCCEEARSTITPKESKEE